MTTTSNSAPLVHVGFPKCASTFLQRTIFPRSSGLFCPEDWSRVAFDRLVLTDAAEFDAARVASEFTPPEGPWTPVLSNENLVGGAAARYDWLVPTADRMAAAFPDARILMVIREQRSMALSLWRQLVKRGEHIPLLQAISPTGRIGYYPRLRLERLRYDRAYDVYVQRFGADNVRVLPYELLVHDHDAFVTQVLEFATGTRPSCLPPQAPRENVGHKALTLRLRRRMNMFSAENYTGPGGPPRSFRTANRLAVLGDRLIPSSWQERSETAYRAQVGEALGQTFAASNHELSLRTGLDLASLGYPT